MICSLIPPTHYLYNIYYYYRLYILNIRYSKVLFANDDVRFDLKTKRCRAIGKTSGENYI